MGDIVVSKAGGAKAQSQALRDKNTDGSSMLDSDGNMTEEGQNTLTRQEEHKTAESLQRMAKLEDKTYMLVLDLVQLHIIGQQEVQNK